MTTTPVNGTRSRADGHAGPGYPATTATEHLLEELALYGVRPGADEPDHRPLPEPEDCRHGLAGIFDTLRGMLADTRLEDDIEDLLWSQVDLFHRKIARVQRKLDVNEDEQRRSQQEQDGSEIRSVELERLVDQGLTLLERRNAFEFLRDHAAELFEAHTGTAWRPRSGSRVSHRTMTAAMVDSRDYINAKRRRETEIYLPDGVRIAFTGGVEYQDHTRIWAVLDKAREKHPDMVLLHGGATRGAELIAARWAENRSVPQVVFKPDWNRHRNAAPFKRNDALLDAMPAGVIAFPGSGITGNLIDKARARGIPLSRHTTES